MEWLEKKNGIYEKRTRTEEKQWKMMEVESKGGQSGGSGGKRNRKTGISNKGKLDNGLTRTEDKI